MNISAKLIAALTVLAGLYAVADAQSPGKKDTLRVFYFGNSLTASSMPELHEELGRSAGKVWKCDAFLGAGWQSWQHRNELWRAMGRPLDAATQSASSRGDLTIDESLVKSAPMKPKAFLSGEWDAIVIQIFGSRLHYVTDEMWGMKFNGPIDVGDVAAASDIIRIFLKKNPQGRVYIYTVWPNMPSGKVPPDDQLPDWAKEMKKRFGSIRSAEFPDRAGFDYAAQWEKPYQGDFDRPWIGHISRTRDYTNQVFEGIKRNFPELWDQRRLACIPAGELFFELDKRMQAGHMPGITTIKDFYTDVQHIRAGLPAYSIAALFYTVLFEEEPDSLDFTIYNDPQKYGPDPHHDRGELLPITPERAKVVNETIWALVQRHPFTHLAQHSEAEKR
ncbi:MAG TPA: hypothetical protein PKI05_06060 [Thermogutta sp.]|nr:hypothetical protein [Thermogutta sp.]HOP78192.1 hypothetical protein [Thermogutta sp.]